MCEEQSRDLTTAANTAPDSHCKQAGDKSDSEQELTGARNTKKNGWW